MDNYFKQNIFRCLILVLVLVPMASKLTAQTPIPPIITVKSTGEDPSSVQFFEGETVTFTIENYIAHPEVNISAYDILWDIVGGGADYDVDLIEDYDFVVTWNEYSVGSNVKIKVEFYDQEDQQGNDYLGDTGYLAISATKTNWYPDSDGDGFGDSYSKYIRLDLGVTPPGYAQNSVDNCPYYYNTSNYGCGFGYENMNWITSKSYDINGTLKASSKSYFNELGKSTQSQSLDTKTGRTWANSAMYDSQGRPALNTLSAPVRESGNFQYEPDFVEDSGNNTYDIADFENNPEFPTPIGEASNTLGHYYSNNNVTDPNDQDPTRKKGNSYQDITDYPFSRTIYSELNPGAVLKTIGGNKQDGEWKQGYTFSMPAGQELTQSVAFGDASYEVSDTRKIIKTVNRDVHGREAVMFTDTDGKTLAKARVGGTVSRSTTIAIREQGFIDVHVPEGTTGFTINGQSGITTEVYDLITEQTTTATTTGLPPGFYRVSITNLESYDPANDPVTVTCKENYYDYSLNEYDETGRLTASYQPIGNTKAAKPKSTFEYNALGQLTQTHSPDEGDAWFLYRKDGQIRFSINSKQWKNNQFSYTHYDDLGRPVESGVYTDNSNFLGAYVQPENVNSLTDPFNQSLKSLVDDSDGLSNGNCSEVQKTTYDYLESTDITFLSGIHSSYSAPTFLAGNVAKTHNDNTTTYYSYDVYGRVKWIVQNITGLGVKTIDYEYDPITGQVNKVLFQKGQSDQFIHRYTYDAIDNSLVKVETSTDDTNYKTHANYQYYETGALKRVELAPYQNTGAPLQSIDYVYNLNGQLKAINPTGTIQSGDKDDLFTMQIDYHGQDYSRNLPGQRTDIQTPSYGENQYNGNIKGVRWKQDKFNDVNENTYSYYYNENNWLTDAVYGDYNDVPGDGSKINIIDSETHKDKTFKATNSVVWTNGFHANPGENETVSAEIVNGTPSKFQSEEYNVFDITYDANGNIRTLNRNMNGEPGSNEMDQLSYNYNPQKPNQLQRVDDAAGQVLAGTDLDDQTEAENYVYNEIGQLIENKEENIEYIYNASGLVTEVKQGGFTRVKFFYNDKGHRIKKEAYVADSPSLDYTEYYVRDAAGTAMAIYRNGQPTEYTIYGASRLGVYKAGSSVYQLTDHLGNVRAVAQWSGTNAVAMVATDYYPFGMPMPGRDIVGDYRYKYQGQEKDPETGKEAFQLRLWDSRIGRWLTTDPYGQFNSPYLGMGNNPISMIDPDGGMSGPGDDPPIKTEQLGTIYITQKGGGGLKSSGVVFSNDFSGNMAQWQELTNHQFSTNHTLAKEQWDVSYGDSYVPLSQRNDLNSIDATGFAGFYSGGHKYWDPDGLGNFLMNATAIGVGAPILAASPLSAVLGTKQGVNMAIDASLQYAFTGTVDIADTAFAGLTSPAISPLLGSLVDVNAYDVNVYMIHGNKSFTDVYVEAGFGYLGYGLKRYSSALNGPATPYIDEFASGSLSIGFQSWLRSQ